MQTIRFKFNASREPETLIIDIPCLLNANGTPISVPSLSYYGEFIDEDGDIHPVAVRYDGTIVSGYYANQDTDGLLYNGKLSIHGKMMVPTNIFELSSKGLDLELRISSFYDGEKWQTY